MNYTWIDIGQAKEQTMHFTPINESGQSEKIKSTQYWKDFQAKGKLIGKILGVEEEITQKEIDKFGQKLAKLGGSNGSAEDGMNELTNLETTINSMNFGQNGLEPKIGVDTFLDLVARGQIENIQVLKELIETRKNRNLTKYLTNPAPISIVMLGPIFKLVGKNIHVSPDNLYSAYNALVGMTNFEKHKNAIGKGEIALALSFNDCKLAEEQGDIETQNAHVEIKGSLGCITSRFTDDDTYLQQELIHNNPKTWKLMSDKITSNTQAEVKEIIKKYNQTPKTFNKKNVEVSINERAIMFAYLFGKTFVKYTYEESHFDKIILISTGKVQNFEEARVAVFNPPRKINTQNEWECYKVGREFLEYTMKCGINVTIASRAPGQYCFKIDFR